MPEEILIIVVFSIAAGTLLSSIRMILGYQERKRGTATQAGSSMTTSELERMMRRAVSDATSSLEKKVEDLEFEIASKSQPRELESVRTDLLIDLEDETEQSEEVTRATRTRS